MATVKILLCCAAGMSTSMVVKKMLEAATQQGKTVEVKAVAVGEFDSRMADYDVFLLGPQIKYRLEDIRAKAATTNKPVAVINSMDYGMMRGDKILADALALLKH